MPKISDFKRSMNQIIKDLETCYENSLQAVSCAGLASRNESLRPHYKKLTTDIQRAIRQAYFLRQLDEKLDKTVYLFDKETMTLREATPEQLMRLTVREKSPDQIREESDFE